jgi:hypothetical protein
MQQLAKRLPNPHGHGSFRPSFSHKTFSPWTMRMPRPTRASDGKPLFRLLIGSKEEPFFGV